MPLIVFICCDPLYNDRVEMKRANEIEVFRLMACAAYIYYDHVLYINDFSIAESEQPYDNDDDDDDDDDDEVNNSLRTTTNNNMKQTLVRFPKYKYDTPEEMFRAVFQYIVDDIHTNDPDNTVSWDFLAGCHTARRDASVDACDPDAPFYPHAGFPGSVLPIDWFSQLLPFRTVYLDCCSGNQIDMGQLNTRVVVCALTSVDYEGIVTETFVEDYPDYVLVAKHAAPSARWAILTLM